MVEAFTMRIDLGRMNSAFIDPETRKPPGTLELIITHGAGNPRDFFSSRAPSLLKFQSLKLKGIEEKRRGRSWPAAGHWVC
ncbi:hypothetical protein AA303_18275 [Pseudomonas psychrophila]|nr:hypothetical protein AA303_18275 [Pseudomonas psychrophila]